MVGKIQEDAGAGTEIGVVRGKAMCGEEDSEGSGEGKFVAVAGLHQRGGRGGDDDD